MDYAMASSVWLSVCLFFNYLQHHSSFHVLKHREISTDSH